MSALDGLGTTTLTDKDVLIAVMGVTGSGKTTFINLATQSPNKLQVGHTIQSCTNAVERADPFDLDGRRIFLFDTPGFDDSNMSETEILGTIAVALENQYRKGQTLHGIIYVHRISDLRVGGLARTNFGIFRKLCGNPSLQNVIIMTNMWSRLSSELEGRRRVEELASVDDFFKPAIVRGAVMMNQIQDTVDSAHAIIRQILRNHPIALDIQKEIVDERKTINQTGAGMAVDEKLAQLAREYEVKLKVQFEAAERARRERDEETRRDQLEEAERVRKILEKLEEEKRNQARQYQLLQEAFIEVERRREQAMREAEERSRRETQAAEARWRHELEVSEQRRAQEKADLEERTRRETKAAEARLRQEAEAAERRRAQEAADLEEMMRNLAIAPPSYSGGDDYDYQDYNDDDEEVNYYTVVSGGTYTLCYVDQNLYATLDRDERHISLKEYGTGFRQQWLFESKDGEKWTIKSVRTGRYLGVTSEGTLRASSNPSLMKWGLSKEYGSLQYEIWSKNGGSYYARTISADKGSSRSIGIGTRIELSRKSGRDGCWAIERV